MSCGVCGADASQGAQRHGLALCEVCLSGDLPHVRAATAWTVAEHSRSEPQRDANGRVVGTQFRYELELGGGPPLEIKATFKREGALQKVRKWVLKEPQVGDARFDDVVYIQGTDGDTLRSLLGPSGRACILELVELGGVVTVTGSRVRVETRQADPLDLVAWRVPLLCLKAVAAR